jgi:hypothetical protein
MTDKINLRQFLDQTRDALYAFSAHWKKQQAERPDEIWPDEMGEADWKEQFLIFQMNYEPSTPVPSPFPVKDRPSMSWDQARAKAKGCCEECTHGYGFGFMLEPPYTCPLLNRQCPGWQEL